MTAPVDVVKAVYAALGARDIPQALSLFSPNIELAQSTELPWGGSYRGHEGARHFLGLLGKHIASKPEFERFIAAGENVVAIGWTAGTAIATGAPFRVAIAHVWTISGGVVTRAHFMIDHPVMLSALAAKDAAN